MRVIPYAGVIVDCTELVNQSHALWGDCFEGSNYLLGRLAVHNAMTTMISNLEPKNDMIGRQHTHAHPDDMNNHCWNSLPASRSTRLSAGRERSKKRVLIR